MKLKLILTTAIVGVALALPSVSSAAPPPPPAPLDTATATGSVSTVNNVGDSFSNIQIDAHSGPSGENPGGSASFDGTAEFQEPGGSLPIPFRVSGPVTCLNVTGNEAVIKIDATVELFDVRFPATWEIHLVDNGGSGSDAFSAEGSVNPADCSSPLPVPVFPLDGRAVVFDAKPLPTSTDQCKNGGWHNFPQFKNQGQCIAFVNHQHGVMCVLHANMSAQNETPPTTSAATGHTQIKVRNDGTIEFKTRINNRNAESFIAGHVHQAPVGVPGPIVVPLVVPPAPPTSLRHIEQSGVATPNAGTTGADLCQDPGAYYVNYHTTVFPLGAIRGQLH